MNQILAVGMTIRLAGGAGRGRDRASWSWALFASLLLLACQVAAAKAVAPSDADVLAVAAPVASPDPAAAPRIVPRTAVLQAAQAKRKPRSAVLTNKWGALREAERIHVVPRFRPVSDGARTEVVGADEGQVYRARAPPAPAPI